MNLLILGAGQYGQLVKELARNQFPLIDFLDDNSSAAVGKLADYADLKDKYQNAIVAIGNPEVRKEWTKKLDEAGFTVPTIVSPQAYVSPSAIVESGCVIEPMTVINTGALIKKGCFINAGAVVNHNAIVGEFSQIDCNSVVCANQKIPSGMHLFCGQVFYIGGAPKNWSFSE